MSELTANTAHPSKRYRTMVLLLLTLIYAFNFIDRQIIGILSPFIMEDLGLSNSQMGLLKGFLFALFYTVVGIPIAWLADRYNRTNIVCISLAVWSGFTALTGIANSFLSIGLARMGVGIGEAGGSPPSHSIISDMYNKDERSGALAIYALGIPLGLGFAYFVAGYALGNPGSDFDWRNLLIILGASGIALAVITRILVREPVRGAQEKAKKDAIEIPFKTALKTLLSIPSWWAMCFGIALASFVGYAVSAWQIDYLLPFDGSQENPFGFQKMMYILALANMIFYGGGTFFGGALAQKLAGKSVSYYALVPAVSILICIPLVIAAFWVPSTALHLVFGAILLFFLGMYLGPSFAIAQTLAPINMRAMSTALFFLILNLIALGGGPTAVGFLADAFKEAHGQVHAIRLAITICTFALVLSAISFFIAAKVLPRDWAAAQSRNEGA
ncbi:spinster family MFS transporter [Fretibacter rubidus]|uniref:spinster family MFS transporter n=1 Tax=Fretibacter rubidus TaxID=570162 RepID=UPI00352A1844